MMTTELDTTTTFDYLTLSVETRRLVGRRVGEIKGLFGTMMHNAVQIGEKLIDVRARLQEEEASFSGWVAAELGWSRSQAYNFIRVAERFGDRPNFAQLDIATSALYLLAQPSTPEPAVEEALARAEAGERVTYTEAKAIVAQHKAPEAEPEPEETPIGWRRALAPDTSAEAVQALEWADAHGFTVRNVAGQWTLLRPGADGFVIACDDEPDLLATVAYLQQHPQASADELLAALGGQDEALTPAHASVAEAAPASDPLREVAPDVLTALSALGWDQVGAPRDRGIARDYTFRHAGTGEEQTLAAGAVPGFLDEEQAAQDYRVQQRLQALSAIPTAPSTPPNLLDAALLARGTAVGVEVTETRWNDYFGHWEYLVLIPSQKVPGPLPKTIDGLRALIAAREAEQPATNQRASEISTSWVDATHATRTARRSLSTYDSANTASIIIEQEPAAATTTTTDGAPFDRERSVAVHRAVQLVLQACDRRDRAAVLEAWWGLGLAVLHGDVTQLARWAAQRSEG
jgi:hypothetical protein